MNIIPARQCIDIGIVVKDIASSLDFYQSFLGLEKLEEVDLPFGRMYRLRFGESFVKLIEPKNVPVAGILGITHVAGLRYFTFPVKNLDDIYARCIEADVTFLLYRQEIVTGVFVVILQDPEGNLVELVERRESKTSGLENPKS